MNPAGNSVLKSYRSFAVNEGLLAKVVEAIKVGEADARRSGQVKSFQVFMHGHRHNIVLGQVMIIPAKIADSAEDFPTTLLAGAMVREISPEAIADLVSYKLGSEDDVYDEVETKDLSAIKDQLFKDVDGKYRSIVLFIPAWGNVRDYKVFKFTKDDGHLTMLVRHQIYACYYDPALSSSFEQLSSDLATTQVNVTDITPKIPFPHLSQGLLQQFPVLTKPEAADVKTAGARRGWMVFAAETQNEALDDLLEPGEKSVLDAMSADMESGVKSEITDGEDFVKSASEDIAGTGLRSQPDYGEEGSHTQEANEAAMKGARVKKAELPSMTLHTPQPRQTNGKRFEWHMFNDNGEHHWSIVAPGMLGQRPVASGMASSREVAQHALSQKLKELQGHTDIKYAKAVPTSTKVASAASKVIEASLGDTQLPTLRKKASTVKLEGEQEVLKSDGASLFTAKSPRHPERPMFVAMAQDGFKEEVVFDGSRVVYDNPDKFPPSFRQAVDRYFHNPKQASKRVLSRMLTQKTKKADVPMGFDEIWKSTFEEMGEPPQVELKENDGSKAPSGPKEDINEGAEKAPGTKSDKKEAPTKDESEKEAPKAEPGKSRTDKLKDMRGEEDAPKGSPKPFEKKEAPKKDEETATEKGKSQADKLKDLGAHQAKCALCHGKLAANGSNWTESSPNVLVHTACTTKLKQVIANRLVVTPILAKFYPNVLKAVAAESLAKVGMNLFESGEVLEQFNPELQGEIVQNPEQRNAPMIKEIGPEPTIPTQSGAGALGIGNSGQPQVLEGAPLRQESDIRGAGFTDEFYQQYEMLDGSTLRAASAFKTLAKRAANEEFTAQFADFLKKVVGEIAATFIAAFKVSSRPMMNKVPGVGEIQLANVEQASNLSAFNIVNTGSRVKWLLSKLNDSDIKAAINSTWAQAAVWSDSPEGGFTYECFVRCQTIDTQTMIMTYEYVIGTKGL